MAEIYDEALKALQRIVQLPMQFNNISIVLLDAVSAYHAPGWVCIPHRHPWYEYNYVSEGTLLTTIDDQLFETGAGESFLIPPGAWHNHLQPTDDHDDGICLRWQITRLGNSDFEYPEEKDIILQLGKVRPYAFRPDMQDELLHLHSSMSIFTIQATFIRWLVSIYEGWKGTLTEQTISPNTIDPTVHQALLYLNDYFASDIRVEELANALHISYRHLARLFKQATGKSIIEQLNETRIHHAKKLLKETNLTTREIAYRTGLKNEHYFANLFRKLELMTPRHYKKSVQKTDPKQNPPLRI